MSGNAESSLPLRLNAAKTCSFLAGFFWDYPAVAEAAHLEHGAPRAPLPPARVTFRCLCCVCVPGGASRAALLSFVGHRPDLWGRSLVLFRGPGCDPGAVQVVGLMDGPRLRVGRGLDMALSHGAHAHRLHDTCHGLTPRECHGADAATPCGRSLSSAKCRCGVQGGEV